MRIANVKIENFRSLLSVEMPVSDITALVGRNGSGKSSILRALHLFYNTAALVTREDFYNRDTAQPIAIQVMWDALTAAESKAYRAYVDGGTLTVRKEVVWQADRPVESYRSWSLQYAPFAAVRAAEGAAAKIKAFNELAGSGTVSGLGAKVKGATAAEAAMDKWEADNADDCVRAPDDGRFFGFRNVGSGKLERFTRFVYVQAVREASEDAVEGKGRSPLSELMDVVVRSVLQEDQEFKEFRTYVRERYSQVFSPDRLPQLPELAGDLTRLLQQYAANAGVSLTWQDGTGPDIQLPKAMAELIEDGFPGDVSRKGHGLQRAFILALLQYLASFRQEEPVAGVEDDGDAAPTDPIVPSLVLAVEEPELYQHPGRQRRLSRVFRELTGDMPDSAGRIQVIYSSHSPLFVDSGHFEEVRLVRKVPNAAAANAPMVSTIAHTTQDCVGTALDEAGKGTPKMTQPGALEARLTSVMTPTVGEGFFADAVVLVEGESDQAAILGAAAATGLDLDEYGVSVVPVGGKTKLDKPFCVFSLLGIPCYVVFDGDKNKGEKGNPQTNEKLLRLLGASASMWPPSKTTDTFACFEDDLERQLRSDWGEKEYQSIMEEARECYGYCATDDACKNPSVMAHALRLARERERDCSRLTDIVNRAVRRSPMCKP